MSAKFEVNDMFSIKDRGHVIVGWIREGVVKVGMTAVITPFPERLVVQGVERINTLNLPPELNGIIGLLFAFMGEQEELVWRNLAIKGQIIDIVDESENPS